MDESGLVLQQGILPSRTTKYHSNNFLYSIVFILLHDCSHFKPRLDDLDVCNNLSLRRKGCSVFGNDWMNLF